MRQSPQAGAAESGAVGVEKLLTLCQSLPAEERARLYAALGGHAAGPDEVARLRKIIDGLAARVAAQSELLTRAAAKSHQPEPLEGP